MRQKSNARGKLGRPPKTKNQTNTKGNVSGNVGGSLSLKGGGSMEYAYQKLPDDVPEPHSNVLADKISAHAGGMSPSQRLGSGKQVSDVTNRNV